MAGQESGTQSAYTLTMPHTSQPVSLLEACTREIERLIISQSVSEAWLESVGLNLPYDVADRILENVVTQTDQPAVNCDKLSGLFTAKIKTVRLDHTLTSAEQKDSLQSYIGHVINCRNLQTLYIGVNINKNLPEEVYKITKKISNFQKLQSLTLKSCSSVLSKAEDTRDLLSELQHLPLHHLDISGASFDEESFRSLLRLKSLTSLCLDSCRLGTLQTLQVLTGLHSLRSLEHNYGKQSRVVQALSTLPDSGKAPFSSDLLQ